MRYLDILILVKQVYVLIQLLGLLPVTIKLGYPWGHAFHIKELAHIVAYELLLQSFDYEQFQMYLKTNFQDTYEYITKFQNL